jgi:hypothetical protein
LKRDVKLGSAKLIIPDGLGIAVKRSDGEEASRRQVPLPTEAAESAKEVFASAKISSAYRRAWFAVVGFVVR